MTVIYSAEMHSLVPWTVAEWSSVKNKAMDSQDSLPYFSLNLSTQGQHWRRTWQSSRTAGKGCLRKSKSRPALPYSILLNSTPPNFHHLLKQIFSSSLSTSSHDEWMERGNLSDSPTIPQKMSRHDGNRQEPLLGSTTFRSATMIPAFVLYNLFVHRPKTLTPIGINRKPSTRP